MSLEYTGKFIGPEEVVSVKEISKTPLGEPVFAVEVQVQAADSNEGAKTEIRTYTKPTLDATLTEKASDWNTFREQKFKHMVNLITEQAIEYGLTGEEMDPLLMSAGRNFATMLDKAVYSKWFGDTNDFVPGGTAFHGFSLLDAHNELNAGNNTNSEREGTDTADKA